MEILWWWAPAVVVTLLAWLWTSWYGRERRGEVDRDAAVKRMGEALTRRPVRSEGRPDRPRDRSTGIAVRPIEPSAVRATEPASARPEDDPGPLAS